MPCLLEALGFVPSTTKKKKEEEKRKKIECLSLSNCISSHCIGPGKYRTHPSLQSIPSGSPAPKETPKVSDTPFLPRVSTSGSLLSSPPSLWAQTLWLSSLFPESFPATFLLLSTDLQTCTSSPNSGLRTHSPYKAEKVLDSSMKTCVDVIPAQGWIVYLRGLRSGEICVGAGGFCPLCRVVLSLSFHVFMTQATEISCLPTVCHTWLGMGWRGCC